MRPVESVDVTLVHINGGSEEDVGFLVIREAGGLVESPDGISPKL